MTDKDDADKRDEPDEPATEDAKDTDATDDAENVEAGEDGEADTEPEPKRGQVRYQDAETTTPREPTVGELRARRKAIEQEERRDVATREEAERKSKLRRRILIGSGVTVGVVAMVAVWYAAATPDEVTANCVGKDDQVIQTDENVCDENYVTSHGGHVSNGIFFLPLIGGGFGQYQYNYGGSGVPGQRVSGGSAAAPSGNARVKTSSGKTVQRGGFGVSSGGGGKSGGS